MSNRRFGLVCFVFPIFSLNGQVILGKNLKKLVLSPHIEYLEDYEKRYSIEDVAIPLKDKFQKLGKEELNFGFTAAHIWLRLQIYNKAEIAQKFFLEIAWPTLDYIEFYELKEKPWKAHLAGSIPNFFTKEVPHRNPIFPLDFAPGEEKIIYLKISSQGFMYVPIYLYEPSTFYKKDRNEQFFYGIFFSVFIIGALYNLFLFYLLKGKVYLYFSFFLLNLGFLIFVFGGFLYDLFLWKNSFFSQRILPVLLALLMGTGTSFFKEFIDSHFSKIKILTIFPFLSFLFAFLYLVFPDIPRLALVYFVAVHLFFLAFYLRKKEHFFSLGFFFLAGFLFLFSVFGVFEKISLVLNTLPILTLLGIGTVSISLTLREIRNRKAQESEKRTLSRIFGEFAIARRIQANILPEAFPQSPYFEIEAMFLPKYDLGGDFYDYRLLPQGCLSAIVADVTGHGVAAALLASMLKIAYATESDNLKNPAQLLIALDEKLKLKMQDHFITAAAIYLDPINLELSYAHAGHPPILHYQRAEGAIAELKGQGPALGLMEKRKCQLSRQIINRGDRLLLFTDGLSDLVNEKNEFFGIERLKSILLNFANEKCSELKLELLRQIAYHKGSLAVTDDITFLIIDIL